MSEWISVKKRLPPEGKWVLVYCKEYNDYLSDVFIAKSGYISSLSDRWLWESKSGYFYTQDLIVGWIDIPQFEADNKDTSGETLKRYEFLDLRT